MQRERIERAFNLDPNRPLHLSTTQGVNQHLSNKSGDKGGERKREGNEQWYTEGEVNNRLRKGGLEGWKERDEKLNILIGKLTDTYCRLAFKL